MPHIGTLSGAALKDALLRRHPWYDQMILTPTEWPLTRAVTGRFSDEQVKRQFLGRGKFEGDDHYNVRVALSQFLGKTGTIAASFAGAVFSREPDVKYAGDDDEQSGIPSKPGTLEAQLEEWADNVDGMGTSLCELLETNSDEAIPMGVVGFYIDKPAMTPEQAARLANVGPGVANADGRPPADIAAEIGLDQMPRAVKFTAENITNWEPDDQGRPAWVLLTHQVWRQKDASTARENIVQWIHLDREFATVFEAPLNDPPAQQQPASSGQSVPGNLPSNEASTQLVFPVVETQVGQPRFVRQVRHGIGMVPFAINYGGGRRFGMLQTRSLLDGCKRADLAGFNERSWATFSRYLHGNPAPVFKTTRPITEIIRDISRGIVINTDESFEYANTDSAAFDMHARAVEEIDLQAYRQAGADPSGMFDGASQPESGKAKSLRFKNTEARSLARIAKDAGDCHFDCLEIAARYLSAAPPPIDQPAFQGSVSYPKTFDLDDLQTVIDQYDAIGTSIKSLTWHQAMLTRIALRQLGDISKETRSSIEDEIEGGTTEVPKPPAPVVAPHPGQTMTMGNASRKDVQPTTKMEKRTPSQFQ